jgi:mRNA interferase MazF
VIRGEVRQHQFPRPDKRRPVVVLTRTSALRFLTRATIAPITSTIRGIPSEVQLGPEDGMRDLCAITLDNLQTVPISALGPPLAVLSPERLVQVEAAIAFALGFTDSTADSRP